MTFHHWRETVLFLSWYFCCVVACFGQSQPSSRDIQDGKPFDAAPFGFTEEAEDGTAYGVRWAQPRKIRRVEVELASGVSAPNADTIGIQYWHNVWDGNADPAIGEVAPIAFGWTPIDDWTNGAWKDADTEMTVVGSRLIFTFHPTGRKEFKNLGSGGVGYRKTLKIRVISRQPMPRPKHFRAITYSICRPLTVRINWDTPACPSLCQDIDRSGWLEAFNGMVLAVRPLTDANVKVEKNMHWTATSKKPGGIEADLLIAVSPHDEDSDRAIITVRTKRHPFSFDAGQVACGNRILVDDFGMLVTRADDPATVADHRRQLAETAGVTIHQRVAQHTEQTLLGAWNDMPLSHQLYFVHGLPGNRNVMRQDVNGGITIQQIDRWFNLPRSPKDTERKGFGGDTLSLDFGFPTDALRGGRELRDGYLPVLRTWWTDGPIHYEQETFMDKLEPDLKTISMDDPTLLLMRIRAVNVSDANAVVRLRFSSHSSDEGSLVVEDDRVLWKHTEGTSFRFLIRNADANALTPEENAIVWSKELRAGESHELIVLIPSIQKLNDKEIESLRGRDFQSDLSRVCDFWSEVTANGAELETPEPWLNDFYKAHLRHEEINCVRDLEAPRRYAKASSFSYGVFPNESVMMIAELDRRGCHETARQCLQAFLDFQGTVPLPGNFQTQDGVLFGAGGWEHIGYNKHHGYIMWGLAEHWRMTRDRQWMREAAPKLIKACDWITRERRATMRSNPDGSRPIHYGLLPAGGLEDVQDYWFWLATNTSTAWGFLAAADALGDFGYPEAGRIKQEADAYCRDVLAAFQEACIRSPVVRLRDGTYVPKFPSEVNLRGRSVGWIRETLEGSISLLAMGLIAPDAPEAKWIVNDHEDNLYISNIYGYSIPVFERFWFSRGGFSMQANLLDGPTCYLKRDEIPHFLRAFFNGFASGFFPETRMLSEHSNPELGYPAGCHFKTPDEAQVCGWLRMMFIHEQGDDLYLGQAIPRYWLTDGRKVAIRRAATHFGPMSLEIQSRVGEGIILVTLTPPKRNPPHTIYLRLRHPEGKPPVSATLNGRPIEQINADKEWLVLPGNLEGPQEVVVSYGLS